MKISFVISQVIDVDTIVFPDEFGTFLRFLFKSIGGTDAPTHNNFVFRQCTKQ